MNELNLTELLFERVPVGIAVFDRDLSLRRCNPTWADFISGYTPTVAEAVTPGRSLYELAPGIEASFAAIVEQVWQGETVHLDSFRSESGGIVSYWDVVLYPLIEEGEVVGLVDVVIDVTERVETTQALQQTISKLQGREEQLEQRVDETQTLFTKLEQRKQELEALYRADEELYRYLSLDSVLNSPVNVAVEILQADKSSVMVWNAAQTQLQVRAHHGFRPETVKEMSFAPGEGMIGQAAQRGQLITVEDSEREEAAARRITEAEGIRAFMHVPIEISGRTFGVFNVSYTTPRIFGEEEQQCPITRSASLLGRNAQKRLGQG